MRNGRRHLAALFVLLLLAGVIPGQATARPQVRYPVVFIPGLAATELHQKNQLVWLNLAREVQARLPLFRRPTRPWLDPLALEPNGQTPASPDYEIRVGNVLRPGPFGIYTAWLDKMDAQGYRKGSKLLIHPYDWRKPIRENARQLEPVIAEALRRNPGSEKVILIGHSMGGLIARDYITMTGGRQVAGMIAVGTPWLGAPVAWKMLVNGHDFGLRVEGTPLTIRLNPDMQRLSQNFPSIYQLLPGRHYHAIYEGMVWRSGTPLPYDQAMREEIYPRNPILAAGASYGDSLMTGRDYGVRQYLVAGYGLQTMVGAEDGPDRWEERYGEGDEIVPLASADLGANYNPDGASRFMGRVQSVAYVRGSHIWLMLRPETHREIRAWLAQINGEGPVGQGRPVLRWHR